MKVSFYLSLALATVLLVAGCKKDDNNPDDNTINLFSVDQDIQLGQDLRDQIAANPADYPILDPAAYPDAYGHLLRIRDEILNSGEVFYKDRFDWECYIIHDDNVLNAFCAPGGYIYVYTGIIKYLDTENEFAGVLGHEIAHADRRHSTDQLTKQYGISLLLDVVLGNNQGALSDIAQNLVNLGYSRSDESEADEFSVTYLCPTDYKADGAAGFFEKIEASGGSSVPEFLSTHPNPDKRVENIKGHAVDKGCNGAVTDGQYLDFKNSLPQ